MIRAVILATFFSSMCSYGQLPAHAKRLCGTWAYLGGSGHQVWTQSDSELTGKEFRITTLGDTVQTEKMRIQYINGVFFLQIESVGDRSNQIANFQDKGRFQFLNTTESFPYSIRYKLSSLSKNKLQMHISYGYRTKVLRLRLKRISADCD